MINIGELIKEAMKKKGVSQKELSLHLGTTQPSVSDWINNKSYPSGDKLIEIALYLDIVEKIFPGYQKVQSAKNLPDKNITEGYLERIEKRLSALEQREYNRSINEKKMTNEDYDSSYSDSDYQKTGNLAKSTYERMSLDELYKAAKITGRSRRLMERMSEEDQREGLIETIEMDKYPQGITKSRGGR